MNPNPYFISNIPLNKRVSRKFFSEDIVQHYNQYNSEKKMQLFTLISNCNFSNDI